MTPQDNIIGDPKYIPVLDHGFVGLVDHMGSDAAIVQAARVSYGTGTKTVNEDRGLIRYLIRNRHSSPVEMCDIKIHIKMPIFVARQFVRHRTHSANEYSGRYSVMSDEMYQPTPDMLKPQSKTNKQGRDGEFSDKEKEGVAWLIKAANEHAYESYEALLKAGAEYPDDRARRQVIYDLYDPTEMGYFDEGYPGLSRELARIVLPLSNYTEMYWKQNLLNMLHLIHLRRDSHAQAEIRAYAEALFQIIQPLFPLTIEAWEDYVWHGKNMSRMDVDLVKELLAAGSDARAAFFAMIDAAGSAKAFADSRGMTMRELVEFKAQWGF